MIEDLFTPMHLLVLFVIIFFLFGAKRLPDLGKSLGHGIREFRSGIAGLSDADQELPADTPDELPPATSGAPTAAAPVGAPTEPAAAASDEPVVIDGTATEIVDEAEATHDGDETVTAGLGSQQERAAS